MKGLAITAGSNLHFLAINGKVQPISLASTIAINKTPETTKEIVQVKTLYSLSISIILAKQTTATVSPKKIENAILSK